MSAQPKGSNLTFRTFEGQQPSPILPAWKNCERRFAGVIEPGTRWGGVYRQCGQWRGHVSAVCQQRTRVATTQYDPFGRFPQWTENALAHREEYTSYNQVLSVVQSIKGINGLVTPWQHDGSSGETVQTRRYAGLRSHHLYGSLGFHHTNVTTAFAGDSRLRRSETCHSQVFPFIGLPIRRKTIGDGVLLGDSTITYEAKYFQSGSTHMAVGRLSTEGASQKGQTSPFALLKEPAKRVKPHLSHF